MNAHVSLKSYFILRLSPTRLKLHCSFPARTFSTEDGKFVMQYSNLLEEPVLRLKNPATLRLVTTPPPLKIK